MKIAVFHFSVTGSSLSRRKQTSMLPVVDHDGLKSQWPVVIGLPSGLPTSVTWTSPSQKYEIRDTDLVGASPAERCATAARPVVAAVTRAVCFRNWRRDNESWDNIVAFSGVRLFKRIAAAAFHSFGTVITGRVRERRCRCSLP